MLSFLAATAEGVVSSARDVNETATAGRREDGFLLEADDGVGVVPNNRSGEGEGVSFLVFPTLFGEGELRS